MPCRADDPLTFCTLHESAIAVVRDYRCTAPRGGPAPEEQCVGNDVVLMRRGAFSKHFGRRSLTADVNQAVFFTKGSTYRVSHPDDCGDRGTVFGVSPRVLNDIVREIDPSIDDHPEKPFPFVTGPCDSGIFWRHHEILERLEAASSRPLDPLWADVTVLQLIADVLRAAFERHGLPRSCRRHGTEVEHAELTEAVKKYLASRWRERVSLAEIAHALCSSPFHLARIFRRRTGMPIHRYLTRLRLRASLDRLKTGAGDLTPLALELGFASHGHFSDAFRREFGRTPSVVRDAGHRALRKMSKNLEA